MPSSSFFTDGETYATSYTTSGDTPGSTTTSQAPSSFFPNGGDYAALQDGPTLLSQMQAYLASTQASAASASTSASNAAASASAAATSASTAAAGVSAFAGTATPLVAGTAAVGTSTRWAHEDHRHPVDTATPDARIANAAGTATPAQAGTAAVGTSTRWAHEDHVHPTDTTRAAVTAIRPKLAGAATWYVNGTTGNDTTGAGTIGSPWATIQKALNVALTWDLNGFLLTVQVADGTYGAGFSITSPFVGGNVLLTGNTTTPSNCVISLAGTGNCFEAANPGTFITVQGFKLVSAGNFSIGIYAHDNACITAQTKMEFGAFPSGTHLSGGRNGFINMTGTSVTISGGANYFANMTASKAILNTDAITFSGSITFAGYFVQEAGCAYVELVSDTWTGSFTGARYNITGNSVLNTTTGNTSLIPGSAAGTFSTGGQYL